MNRKIPMLVALPLLAMLLLVGCRGDEAPNSDTSEIPRISVEEVKAELDAGADIVIVDTRAKEEYEEASIAGAISIPLSELLDENDDPLSTEEISGRYGDLNSYDEIIFF